MFGQSKFHFLQDAREILHRYVACPALAVFRTTR